MPLQSIPKVRIILIQNCGRHYRKRIFKSFFRFLSPPESNHDKLLVYSPIIDSIIGLFGPSITKYTEKNLQKILKIVLKTQALFDGSYEKLLKARLADMYYGKFYIECYNFYQQYEDYFAIARAESSNYIFFTISFLCDCINFY